MLVLGDVRALWDMDLGGAVLGAVVDTDSIAHSERLRLALGEERTGQSEPIPVGEYFNVGALLIDMQRWREQQVSDTAVRFMADNPNTPLADQDALNVACARKWKKLDARWNCQTHTLMGYKAMAPEQRPQIVHFAGRFKPWEASSLSVDADFYDGWRSRTRFARTPLEKVYDGIRKTSARLRSRLRKFETLRTVYRSLTDSRAEVAEAGIKL